MTAPTPEQMRVQAMEAVMAADNAERRSQTGHAFRYRNMASTLRASADQLEAVRQLLTEAHTKFAATYDAERMTGRGPSSIGVAGAPLASSVQRALDLLRAKATANIERLTADTAPQERDL